MITLDGSYLEGGGQIVRTALALSTLTQKPFTVTNIRANRTLPGLKNQHLWGILALKDLTGSVVENATLGSTTITYYPHQIKKQKEITIDVQTAGSVTLLLQTLLLPLLFSGKRMTMRLRGGTDVAWSPSYDYFAQVVLPQFRRYGIIDLTLQKRGYYPKGCGEMTLACKKRFLYSDSVKPLSLLEQGTLVKIAGMSHASADLEGVAERQADAARAVLQRWKVPIDIVSSNSTTASAGSGITLWAIFSRDHADVDSIDPIRIGADVLGERGKRAELVGQDVAQELNKAIASGAPVDTHLADQLIPLLGIVSGEIAVQGISSHTLTNIFVAEQFLDVRFDVDEKLRIVSVKKGKFGKKTTQQIKDEIRDGLYND